LSPILFQIKPISLTFSRYVSTVVFRTSHLKSSFWYYICRWFPRVQFHQVEFHPLLFFNSAFRVGETVTIFY
jgi:hypothetical protein